MNLNEKARQARNEYQRRWRAANPEKVRAANERYWERRAEKDMYAKEGGEDHAANTTISEDH